MCWLRWPPRGASSEVAPRDRGPARGTAGPYGTGGWARAGQASSPPGRVPRSPGAGCVVRPGTAGDLKWWTGWTVSQVRQAVAAVGAVEVDLDGGTGLLLAHDLDPVTPAVPWVALLPAVDPRPMAWSDRSWCVGPHREGLFDRSGNVAPPPGPTGASSAGGRSGRTAASRSGCWGTWAARWPPGWTGRHSGLARSGWDEGHPQVPYPPGAPARGRMSGGQRASRRCASSRRTSVAGATWRYASSTTPATSCQSGSTSSRIPIQPRWPT